MKSEGWMAHRAVFEQTVAHLANIVDSAAWDRLWSSEDRLQGLVCIQRLRESWFAGKLDERACDRLEELSRQLPQAQAIQIKVGIESICVWNREIEHDAQ